MDLVITEAVLHRAAAVCWMTSLVVVAVVALPDHLDMTILTIGMVEAVIMDVIIHQRQRYHQHHRAQAAAVSFRHWDPCSGSVAEVRLQVVVTVAYSTKTTVAHRIRGAAVNLCPALALVDIQHKHQRAVAILPRPHTHNNPITVYPHNGRHTDGMFAHKSSRATWNTNILFYSQICRLLVTNYIFIIHKCSD